MNFKTISNSCRIGSSHTYNGTALFSAQRRFSNRTPAIYDRCRILPRK